MQRHAGCLARPRGRGKSLTRCIQAYQAKRNGLTDARKQPGGSAPHLNRDTRHRQMLFQEPDLIAVAEVRQAWSRLFRLSYAL
jgi:hypothetical protein